MAFFLSPARARFPAPRRAWVPPLAGSGAGCTLVAVHAVGVHRFPAPAKAACAPPPRALAPSPAGRPATAGRRHLQSHPGPRVCNRDDRDFISPQTGKESGGLEGSPATHSILLANLLCDLGQLISPLWATILGKTRWFQDDFLESFLQIASAFVEPTLRAQCVEETGLRPERAYYQLKD